MMACFISFSAKALTESYKSFRECKTTLLESHMSDRYKEMTRSIEAKIASSNIKYVAGNAPNVAMCMPMGTGKTRYAKKHKNLDKVVDVDD